MARFELAIVTGSPPPDVELTETGTNAEVHFQRITRNVATFGVVAFTGNLDATRLALHGLETFLLSADELTRNTAIGWLTICPTVGCSPYEALGMNPFGDTYFDSGSVAHDKFGIDPDQGSVIILRPDSLAGSSGPIEGGNGSTCKERCRRAGRQFIVEQAFSCSLRQICVFVRVCMVCSIESWWMCECQERWSVETRVSMSVSLGGGLRRTWRAHWSTQSGLGYW